jgi:hypothetical protein
MDKDIFELIVKRLTNCNDKTKQVMDIVFGKQITINDFKKCENGHFYKKEEAGCYYCNPIFKITTVCPNGHLIRKGITDCPDCEDERISKSEITKIKPTNKKQEIIDSLSYLKSKDVKTKKDVESIYMLEMILKNLK